MAYNPFNIFRRNQKAIFAVVTVFIMFTFVLSSGIMGGADFFDWFPRWLGSRTKQGDVLCSIDGSKIYSSEVEKLRFQRVMANRYMNMGAQFARANIDSYVKENAGRMSPEARSMMEQVNQFEQFLQFSPGQAPLIIQNMRSSVMRIINSPAGKPDDKEVARAKYASLTLLQALIVSGGDAHFFGNAPNRSNRDLVNFMLWQKKADQLGIRFTTDDIKRLIDREFYSYFLARSQVEVQKSLQQSMQGFSMSKCLEAVGEEFRVRAAQVALLGPGAHGGRFDKTFGGFPAFSTPYEMFEYYRDNCSPTQYGAIPVPAVNFLPQIKEPDEHDPTTRRELLALFDKYQNDEPNFGRESPGFKEPRKVRVEWLALSATDPYYVKEAEKQLKDEFLQAHLRTVIIAPAFGLAAGFIHHARPFAIDPQLAVEYEALEKKHWRDLAERYGRHEIQFNEVRNPKRIIPGFIDSDISIPGVAESSIVRPGVLAAAIGGSAGQALSFGHHLAAIPQAAGAPMAYELRDRVRAGMPAVLMALGSIPGVQGKEVFGLRIDRPVPGGLPGPALFANLLGGAAAYQMMLPKPLPLETVKEELIKKISSDKAKDLVRKDTDDFIKEVNKLSDTGKVRASDKEKLAAIRKYIKEFAAKRNLTVAGNKAPQSEWTIEEDPGLSALVKVQKESLKSPTNPHSQQYIPFANSFFWVRGDRRNPVAGIYTPSRYPEQTAMSPTAAEDKPQYLTWRAEEVPSKLPGSPNDAMPAVKAAWMRIKAREEAEKRANKIAEVMNSGGPPQPGLLQYNITNQVELLRRDFAADPKAAERIAPFLFDGVCPLTAVANPAGGKDLYSSSSPTLFAPVMPFSLPPTENVKYPSRVMGQKLLDERKKDPKTTFVIHDEPKDVFFVVTLIERTLKKDTEFQMAIYSEEFARFARDQAGPRDAVLGNFNAEAQQKAVDSVMGMLKKEFKYEESDEQKKKLDERRGSD